MKRQLARTISLILLTVQLTATAFAGGDSCLLTTTPTPPFYLTNVTENRTDTFAVSGKKKILESRDPAEESEISSEDFHSQASQLARRSNGNATVISKGSIVEPVTEQDQAAYSDLEASALFHVQVVKTNNLYAQYQTGGHAKAGDQGFISKGSLDPSIDKKTFVLKHDTVLLKMAGLSPLQLSAGMFLRPVILDGKYKIRKCGNAVSYVFNAIVPFGQKHEYSNTEVLLPKGGSCIDAPAYTMDQFQDLLKIQVFTNTLYKKNYGLDQFEINDWGMVKVPFVDPPEEISSVNHDITGASPDGSFLHYQGTDPKGSDIWGQPKTVCALMKVMEDWSKRCNGPSDLKCIPETGDVSFITPAKVVPTSRSTDGVDPLGHKSHYTGYCVDVRPFKKTDDTHGMTYRQAGYDRQRTREFIDFLEHEGASPIYFNDPTMYNDKSIGGGSASCSDTNLETETNIKVRPCAGHNDHIHFCLLPANFPKLGC